MSQRLAERASVALGSKLGRRGFLARSAVAGSALAAAPSAYVLKPVSAYAAICSCSGYSCSCGSLCCDGYTEFCCTITGQNRCPAGTLTGGWWKVDGSSFCGGAARYYVDCNARCGTCGCGSSGICSGSCSGTGCGCARGSCANRKAGCTGFRYGQCNQSTPCLGPIVCRVVTCIPPWQTDPACGTAIRVDNNTRNHHRPCLTGDPFGRVDGVTGINGQIRVRGWTIDPNTTNPLRVHIYLNGAARLGVTADRSRPDVARVYPGSGDRHGFDTSFNVAPGTYDVCVYAINVGEGAHTRLACSRVTVPADPFGTLDLARMENGRLRVRGWAIDPNTNNPIRVHVYDNGRGVKAVTADLDRPDVGARWGRGNHHGFDTTVPVSVGTHDITVYAINVGAGHHRAIGTARVVWDGSPFGALESVTAIGAGQVRVVGWAIDAETDDPIRVHVYDNGHGAKAVTADVPRPDLEHLGYGIAHGYDTVVDVGAGAHQICTYGINVGSGRHVQLGCRSVSAT